MGTIEGRPTVIADTCVAIWLMTEPERLSAPVRLLVKETSVRVLVSAITLVEIGIKCSTGKLRLPKPPRKALPELCRAFQLEPLAFGEAAAYFMAELPDFHRDPFDRMIICQAMESGLPILTPDESFRRYDVRVIW